MAGLKCLISMHHTVNQADLWYSNGYSQNVKFFYDLLELMGHEPVFMTPVDIPGNRFTLLGKEYRFPGTHRENSMFVPMAAISRSPMKSLDL